MIAVVAPVPATQVLATDRETARRAGALVRLVGPALDVVCGEGGGVQDFWLFDQSDVALMNYEPDGRQISRKVFEGDVAPFLKHQRIAVAESVPFEEYVARLGL